MYIIEIFAIYNHGRGVFINYFMKISNSLTVWLTALQQKDKKNTSQKYKADGILSNSINLFKNNYAHTALYCFSQ